MNLKTPRTLIILGRKQQGSASIFRIGAGLSAWGSARAWAPRSRPRRRDTRLVAHSEPSTLQVLPVTHVE